MIEIRDINADKLRNQKQSDQLYYSALILYIFIKIILLCVKKVYRSRTIITGIGYIVFDNSILLQYA